MSSSASTLAIASHDLLSLPGLDWTSDEYGLIGVTHGNAEHVIGVVESWALKFGTKTRVLPGFAVQAALPIPGYDVLVVGIIGNPWRKR